MSFLEDLPSRSESKSSYWQLESSSNIPTEFPEFDLWVDSKQRCAGADSYGLKRTDF